MTAIMPMDEPRPRGSVIGRRSSAPQITTAIEPGVLGQDLRTFSWANEGLNIGTAKEFRRHANVLARLRNFQWQQDLYFY